MMAKFYIACKKSNQLYTIPIFAFFVHVFNRKSAKCICSRSEIDKIFLLSLPSNFLGSVTSNFFNDVHTSSCFHSISLSYFFLSKQNYGIRSSLLTICLFVFCLNVSGIQNKCRLCLKQFGNFMKINFCTFYFVNICVFLFPQKYREN